MPAKAIVISFRRAELAWHR